MPMGKKKIKKIALPGALSAILVFLIILTYQVIFRDKFFPLTYLGDTNITFLTKAQAQRVVNAKFSQRAEEKLQFDSLFIDLATSSARLDYSALDETFKIGKTGTFTQRLIDQFKTLFFNAKAKPKIYLNLDSQLEKIAAFVYQKPQDAQLIFSETSQDSSPSARFKLKRIKTAGYWTKKNLRF